MAGIGVDGGTGFDGIDVGDIGVVVGVGLLCRMMG